MSEDDELQSAKKSSKKEGIKMEVDRRKTSEDKSDKSQRNSHSEIEKRRRDKMNQYINDLSTMIPMPPSVTRKPDKLTVLRLTVQHMKALRGAAEPSKETSHKPGFLSDDDLRNLITEASGGFLIVVECDRGQVLYVTDSVEDVLNLTQADVVRSNLYELVHSKDVAMIKNQLSLTATNGKKGEVVDVNVAPVVKENVEKSGKLCPGAKRSFLCRMKRGAKLENFEKPHTIESSETSSNARKTKGNVPVDEKNHILTSFEGYLKSWPPNTQAKQSNESDSRCCLVAIGRAVKVHDEQTDYTQLGQVCEFETRHRADGVFVRVDNRFTTILGYYPDEVVGKSAYNFFHKDDLKYIADAHQQALYETGSRPEVTYRFRAKAGHYVPLRTTSVAFRNPWSKEIDCIITQNVVVTPISSTLLLINNKQIPQNEKSLRESSYANGDYDYGENVRDLLRKLDSLEGNEGKSQRKRIAGSYGLPKADSTRKGSPDDIGVLIARQAKKIGEKLKSNSRSGHYSNAPLPQESSAQAVVNGGSAQLVHPQRSDTNHRQGGILNDSVGSNLKTQGDLPDNILLEQLAGIQGAIDAMENNTTTAEDDERFSLFMNVIDNDEDLGNVLNDMPWNFM